MSFREFFELYKRDRKPRIRENTWRTKEAIVNQKILPYIGDLIFQLAKVIKKFGKLNDDEADILIYILEIYEKIKKEKSPYYKE